MKPKELSNKKEVIVIEMTGRNDLPAGYAQHYFTHILCARGTASFRIENKRYKIGRNEIAIVLPSSGIKQLKCSRDFRASCLR